MKSIDKFILPLGLFLVSIFYVPWLWYPFNWGKWSLIHLLATVCFVRWTAMGMPFPKCKKWESALFGLVALFAMGQAVLKSNLFVFCDRLSFFIILLYAFACLKEKKLQLKDFYWSIALSIFCLVTIGLYQVTQVFSYQELQQKNIGSIFGFSNNAAQSLVAMLGVLAWLSNTGKRKIYLIIILVASIVYLYFLQSRSIYISISIGVFAYALGYLYRLKKKEFFFGFIGLGLLVAGLGVFYQKKIDSVLLEKLPFSKGSMIDWREDLWSRSLPMIRDFPMGLGPFRYEFAYVPYLRGGIAISEQNSPDNPHNEFLRFLIEDGVLFAPIYLVAVVVLIASAFSIFSSSILFLIGFYFSEMFFQFIWMNPYTFFLGSIFFAFCLSVRQQRTFQILKNEIVKKIVII
ncbi:MAG: O-antigen ligase family protein [Oligoflexia bacterium]|nr:O-antigen ligase family protein [Oligoflexia bacterium]